VNNLQWPLGEFKDWIRMPSYVLSLAVLAASMLNACGQGQIYFNTKYSFAGINARVFEPNGEPAVSPPYAAALVVDENGGFTLVPGSVTTFRSAPAIARGFVNGLVVKIPGYDIGSTVTVRMIAFVGSTEAQADFALNNCWPTKIFGMSNPVTVTLGGGIFLPPDMVGLLGFTITDCVPEPSIWALLLCGLAILGWQRLKTSSPSLPRPRPLEQSFTGRSTATARAAYL
jgi:hypothetical protein